MDSTEKAHRKELLRSMREEGRRAAKARFPVDAPVLEELFEFLDGCLSENECDHTLRFTSKFILNKNLPEERVIAWLEQEGGFCDCEVLSNVEPAVEDTSTPDR